MRSHKRSARHALLSGLVVYLAMQAGLVLLLTVGMTWLRSPNYGHKLHGLRARIKPAPRQPFTVVMLGSSRTAKGVRGDLVEEPLTRALGRPVVVYNFGIAAAGPVDREITLTLKTLISRRFRDKVICSAEASRSGSS